MKLSDVYYIASAYRQDRLNARHHRRDLARRADLAARIRARLAAEEPGEVGMSDDQVGRIAALLAGA